MSSSPSDDVTPHIFYYPAFWCHYCDMSINLPRSPTPLLCPHCNRDSLEQMELDIPLEPPSPDSPQTLYIDPAHGFPLTPYDGTFRLYSPLRDGDQLTATAMDVENPRSNPAPKSSIDSLQEITVGLANDSSVLCPVCKDPFEENSVAKLMPCKHAYHSECIVPWLEINNSCPVCRCKLPTGKDKMRNGRGEDVVFMSPGEFVDGDSDLYGFMNTLWDVVQRNQGNEQGPLGGESEENQFSASQAGDVQRDGAVLASENNVETMLSWP